MMGTRRRAAVVVLGDLGRSPRMQYHALSLANQVLISIVSLVGTFFCIFLTSLPNCHLRCAS